MRTWAFCHLVGYEPLQIGRGSKRSVEDGK
jgi:hypothetical protein